MIKILKFLKAFNDDERRSLAIFTALCISESVIPVSVITSLITYVHVILGSACILYDCTLIDNCTCILLDDLHSFCLLSLHHILSFSSLGVCFIIPTCYCDVMSLFSYTVLSLLSKRVSVSASQLFYFRLGLKRKE